MFHYHCVGIWSLRIVIHLESIAKGVWCSGLNKNYRLVGLLSRLANAGQELSMNGGIDFSDCYG